MLTITITISDADEMALKHDLLDIEQWVHDAVRGKINNCKGRLINQELPKVLADPSPKQITNEASLVQTILARPGYLSRAARERAGLSTLDTTGLAATEPADAPVDSLINVINAGLPDEPDRRG